MIKKIKLFQKAILLFTLASLGVLTFNSSYLAVSQTSQLYVTVGHSSSRESASKIISYDLGLKVGLNWAVFNLRHNKYWGTARVNKNYCDDCTNRKGSELIPNRRYPTRGEELLLLRPIPKNPARVNIKKVSFSQLPTAVRKEVNKKLSPYQGKYTGEECYAIDINSDGSLDIVKATVIVGQVASGYDSLFVRFSSTWILKYQRGWVWE